jgi:CubicO group peptidase (beta-lactamase class C family)
MLKLGAAVLLALLPLPALAQQPATRITAVIPEVDRIFADFQLDTNSPGLVYGIVDDGRLVHVRALGVQDLKSKRPVTADSLFGIASMTKAFTALAILKLRDEGKLSLDAAAETYVPELRGWRYPTADSPRITVRHLLGHTAGLVDDNPWGDRQQPLPEEEFTAMLRAGVPFSRPPGTAYEYSNFGYALLGRIVGNVSGIPYRQYVETNILRPLGMNSTGYVVRDLPLERRAIGYRWENGAWSEEPAMAHGSFGAIGGIQTSANDYAKYVAWLLSAWPARDDPEAGPVRRATVRELGQGISFMQSVRRPGKSGADSCRQANGYGKAMRVAVDCDIGTTLAHSGGYPGYGSYVLLLPEHNVGIFAFSNRTYNGSSGQVWDVAVALHKAGALTGRTLPISSRLASAYAAAGTIYRAGDVGAARDRLAMNFLMDRSQKNWRAALHDLKSAVGACATDSPIKPTGNLSGTFTWRCQRGRISGSVLLAPTAAPSIQELRLAVATP